MSTSFLNFNFEDLDFSDYATTVPTGANQFKTTGLDTTLITTNNATDFTVDNQNFINSQTSGNTALTSGGSETTGATSDFDYSTLSYNFNPLSTGGSSFIPDLSNFFDADGNWTGGTSLLTTDTDDSSSSDGSSLDGSSSDGSSSDTSSSNEDEDAIWFDEYDDTGNQWGSTSDIFGDDETIQTFTNYIQTLLEQSETGDTYLPDDVTIQDLLVTFKDAGYTPSDTLRYLSQTAITAENSPVNKLATKFRDEYFETITKDGKVYFKYTGGDEGLKWESIIKGGGSSSNDDSFDWEAAGWKSEYGEFTTILSDDSGGITYGGFNPDTVDTDPNFTKMTLNGKDVYTTSITVADTEILIALTKDGKILMKEDAAGNQLGWTLDNFTEGWTDGSTTKKSNSDDDLSGWAGSVYADLFGRDLPDNILETLTSNEEFLDMDDNAKTIFILKNLANMDDKRRFRQNLTAGGESIQEFMEKFGFTFQELQEWLDWDFQLNQPWSKTLEDIKEREEKERKEKEKASKGPKGFVLPKNVIHIGDEDADAKNLRFNRMGMAGRNYASAPFAGMGLLSTPTINKPSLVATKFQG